jgi:uncharacterized protein (TIGR02597 family)
MNFRLSRRLLAVAAIVFGVGGNLLAQSVSTDPVGAVNITLYGGSDTHISLPFHRTVAVETQAEGISGNVITVSSSANITANEFVYVSGSQSNTYYLQFMTGSREGMYYTIVSNTATNITVNNNGDTGLDGNVSVGDTFRIIPYWTLNTLFPSGQSLYTGSNFNTNTQSLVLVLPGNVAGINLSAEATYLYYTGSNFGGPGWRATGNVTQLLPDIALPPDSFLIVRHPPSVANTELTLVGNVPMSQQAVILNALQASTPQDNPVSLPVPVSVTFGNSGLASVINGSNSFNPSDYVLMFDPTVVAQNKSATAEYFYYNDPTDSFGGAGWRKLGDPLHVRNNDVLSSPGQGFIVRLGSRSSPTTLIWDYLPPYVSN